MGLKGIRLKKPTAKETSGVDHPAHKSPGWWVMKSEGEADPDLDAVLETIANEDENAATTTEGVPAGDGLNEGEPVAPTPTPPVVGTPDAGTGNADTGTPDVAKQLEDLKAELAVEKAEREKSDAARAALTKAMIESTGGDPASLTAEAIEKADFAKALATLPEPIQKAWMADRERIAKAEKQAHEDHEALVSRTYLEKAEGFAHLPTNREVLGSALRAVDGLAPEAKAEVTRLLKAADEAFARDPLFVPHGGDGEAASGAEAELTAKAADIQKSDPSLSRQQAVTKALDADPDLDRRVSAEKNGGSR